MSFSIKFFEIHSNWKCKVIWQTPQQGQKPAFLLISTTGKHTLNSNSKRLDIHHSYDYLGSADLQSLKCYEQRASTPQCDLGPSEGRTEMRAQRGNAGCSG